MKVLSSIVLTILPMLSYAAEIPEPVLPAGVGVNIHFVIGHERDLDLIQAAGFKFIRMDFGWGSTERRKGQYDWAEYEQLLDNLERRGIRPVFIFDYSHGLYEETVTNENPVTHQMHRTVAAPQHPESVEAYARWAAAAAKHFAGRHVIWEIWNEPNIQFWSPKPDAGQYAALALAAAKAVRAADPGATVVAPASSTFPWQFLETLFKSGILEYLDAVSVHPYRGPRKPPESAATDYQRLRQLIDQYAPAARQGQIPIFSGEWGYSSFAKGVYPEGQAAFAVRQQLSNLLNGVPLSIWYDWKNDGSDPKENEHNFGMVLPDLTPKPAYLAIRTLTHELSGYHIERRLRMDSDQDYVLVLVNAAGQRKIAAWSLGDAGPLHLTLRGKAPNPLIGVGCFGAQSEEKQQNGDVELNVSEFPQYVALGEATVAP